MVHNGGSRAAPVLHGLLHGEDFPRTLMKGSSDGAVEPVRHRQETLTLTA
jgi:hypothetical protein